MPYLSTNTEEGNCVFIAYMLNSVKQQMICNEWSNWKVTRRDYNVSVLDQKPQKNEFKTKVHLHEFGSTYHSALPHFNR